MLRGVHSLEFTVSGHILSEDGMADDTEDVLDNWEDEDAEVHERRMEERQKQKEKEKKKRVHLKAATLSEKEVKTKGEMDVVTLEAQTHLPLRTQNTGRTEYVAPIKILKRRTADTNDTPSNAPPSSTAPAKPRKTLAEREADYATARARILGSGYRTAEDTSGSPSSSPKPPTSSRDSAESIKRQPKGPNGTKGFKSNS